MGSMIYLVTGGKGFIGSNLVDHLLDKGHAVVIIDNNSSGKEENIAHHASHPHLTVYNRDVVDPLEDIFEIHKPIEAVFHLAAIPQVQFSIKNPLPTHRANINGTLNLLEHCRNFDVKRFIFSSSSAIYGDQEVLPLHEDIPPRPLSPYALHKLTGEHYCKLFHYLYGIQAVSLRYANVFGPRQDPHGAYAGLIPKFITLIRSDQQPVIYGDGETTRDFIYVDDVVSANMYAAHTDSSDVFGYTFNIGSTMERSVNDVTDFLLRMSGKDMKPQYSSPVIEPRRSCLDSSKAKRLLGWEPQTSFEDGLKKTYDYFTS